MNNKVVRKCCRCKIIKPLSSFKEDKNICKDCEEDKPLPYIGKVCTKCKTYKKIECFEQNKEGKYKKRCKICSDYYKKNTKKCNRCGRLFIFKTKGQNYCSSTCEVYEKLKHFKPKVNVESDFIIERTGEKFSLYDFYHSSHRSNESGIWFIFINNKKEKIAVKLNNIYDDNCIRSKIRIGERAERGVLKNRVSEYFIGQLVGSQVVKRIITPERGFEYATTCIKCGFNYKTPYYCHNRYIEGRYTPDREMNGKCKFCETGHAIIPEKNSAFAIHDEYLFSVIDNKEIEKTKYIGSKSNVKVKVICPKCGEVKYKTISDIVREQSIGCNCGRGTSYPEKIFIEMLRQLKIKFIKEYNSNSFLEGSNKRYDFYIPDKDLIIEAHGEQHYTEVKKWGKLEETQRNDAYKKQIALEHGKENYIVVDCRKSEVEYIKQNIMISKLSKIFNLTNINWQLCHEYATGIYKGTREE